MAECGTDHHISLKYIYRIATVPNRKMVILEFEVVRFNQNSVKRVSVSFIIKLRRGVDLKDLSYSSAIRN